MHKFRSQLGHSTDQGRLLEGILNDCQNIQSLLHKKSTSLCLTQCNFVTLSDFVKSIHQPVHWQEKEKAKSFNHAHFTVAHNLNVHIFILHHLVMYLEKIVFLYVTRFWKTRLITQNVVSRYSSL